MFYLNQPAASFLHIVFCRSPSSYLNAHFDGDVPFFSADVKNEIDDLSKTMKNFEARVGFAKDLETISAVCCITTSRHKILCKT